MKRVGMYLLAGMSLIWAWLVTDAEVFSPVHAEATEAAAMFSDAVEVIREERIRRGIPIDGEADVDGTGLIGVAYSPLTSTLGSLPAKRMGSTPDSAALMVNLIEEAVDVERMRERGDAVAVNCSGSFPGFCIAALAACSALDLKPVVTLSIGSSSWGGNIPGFTVSDMVVTALNRNTIGDMDREVIHLVTPGGASDRGVDLDGELMQAALARAEVVGLPVSVPERLEDAITLRQDLYGKAGATALLITIGGNAVATGADPEVAGMSGVLDPGDGLLSPLIADTRRDGLVLRYLRNGAPVIQVLQVERLFSDAGLTEHGGVYRGPGGGPWRALVLVPGLILIGLFTWTVRARRLMSTSRHAS